MTFRFALLVAAALMALQIPDARAAEPVVAAKTVRDDLFPRPPVPFANGLVGEPDIEYENLVGFRPLLLDLYRRPGQAPRPLVIYIHGGGWDRGDSRGSGAFADFPAVLASLAARGYVVASLNYRLSGEAKFPAAIQDVKAAIHFLRASAAKYGIDPTRVILWGGSAGAHLAALAAASCGVAAFEPVPSTGRLPKASAEKATVSATSDCVQGAALWYAPVDLVPLLSGPLGESIAGDGATFLGCARDCSKVAALASPVTYISANTPPMLLIQGEADNTVPPVQSEEMAAKLKAAGVPVETLFIPSVDHGFIGPTPQATRDASLLALQRTFAFIDAVTARKKK